MSDTTTSNTSHTEAAQAFMQKIQELRESIPNLAVPATPRDARRIGAAATLSHDFVEETVAATESSSHLALPGAIPPAQMRDLLSFAEAWGPAVAQADALTRFLRHTVNMVKYKTGSQALTTYAFTQRLAKKPETAYLRPFVEAMRQKLGRRAAGRRTPAEPAPVPPNAHTEK